MKFRIFILLAAFLWASCSGDDGAPVTDGTGENSLVLKQLRKITVYELSETMPSEIWIFDNDLPLSHYTRDMYTGTQELTKARHFEYQNGLVSRIAYTDNDNWVLLDEYTYDDQGRLIHIEKSYLSNGWASGTENLYCTYTDAMVTLSSSDGDMQPMEFYLNKAGQVYKQYDSGFDLLVELSYQGNNLTGLRLTTAQSVSGLDYNYDLTIPVKGHYLDFRRNMHGNQANQVLLNRYLINYENYSDSDNYLISLNSITNGFYLTYEYEFDADGYPIQKKEYSSQGMLNRTEVIEYY